MPSKNVSGSGFLSVSAVPLSLMTTTSKRKEVVMSSIPEVTSLNLTSCHVIEEWKGDLLWSWNYPYLTPHNRSAYSKKCRLLLGQLRTTGFQFFHHGDQWVYIQTVTLPQRQCDLVAVVLCAADFNPERYLALSRIMATKYESSGAHPPSILQAFLCVQTTGKCTGTTDDIFYFQEYDNNDLLKLPKLREMIEAFGLDVILIYTSLLLKRRMLVYHHDISKLYEFILSLPAFVVHRLDLWQHIYPITQNSDTEFEPFQNCDFYIVGSTDEHVWNRSELYDLYVNIPAAEVMVAPHARDALTMTKTHKDIALFMVQLCDKKGLTQRDIMHEIARKTKDLLDNLRLYMTVLESGREALSLKELRSREFSPTLETFLVGLAQGEKMVIQE